MLSILFYSIFFSSHFVFIFMLCVYVGASLMGQLRLLMFVELHIHGMNIKLYPDYMHIIYKWCKSGSNRMET